jgi:hypothetical protein
MSSQNQIKRQNRTTRRSLARANMGLEALESRQLRSATPLFATAPVQGDGVLVISDTGYNDAITVTQQGSILTVLVNQQMLGQYNANEYSGMRIKADGGSNYVYLDPSVTITATLKGMGGDDTLVGGSGDNILKAFFGDNLMNGGAGVSRLVSKGDGQDTLIGIAGDDDTLTGGSGNDSFWVNYNGYEFGNETIENYTGNENIQEVNGFQSYNALDQYGNEYTVTPGLNADGQSLMEPGYATAQNASLVAGWTNVSGNPLFAPGGAVQTDIQQNGLGDCYFLSTLANIAKNDPQLLENNITPLGDGTYAVMFIENGMSTYYRVDGEVPADSNGNPLFATIPSDSAIWSLIYEKAYTEARPSTNADADYGNIEGGDPTEVFTAFGATGINEEMANQFANGSQLIQWVYNQLNEGKAVEFLTTTDASQLTNVPLAENHAYTVEGVETENGVTYLELRNPWGYNGGAQYGSNNDGFVAVAANLLPGTFDSVDSAWV